MSVILTAGRKAMQEKAASLKKKEKRKRSGRASSARGGPPVSSDRTTVWYWLLNSVPTTILYDKNTNEIWCNGYVLESQPTFWPGGEFANVQVFSIYLEELQTMHNGRICQVAGSDADNPIYVLYVDGYLVPERTSAGEGISADIVSIPGLPAQLYHGCEDACDPPCYAEAVFGAEPLFVEPTDGDKKMK